MEMAECPACGNVVAVQARQCPHCGQPFRRGNYGLLIISILVACIGTCMKVGYDDSQKPSKQKYQQQEKEAEDSIKRQREYGR